MYSRRPMDRANRMTVTVPVTDLRRKPVARRAGRREDPLQESQLLMGEEVRLIGTRGRWAHVDAVHQLTRSPEGWGGYRGWILREHLGPSEGAPRWNAMVKKARVRVALEGPGPRALDLSL